MSAVLKDDLPAPRDMLEADLAGVMAIERAAYEFPWTEGIMRDCFKFGYLCKVYATSREIVGYAFMSVGAGECHFLNICIAPAVQKQGHGARFLVHLLRMAREAGARSAHLEVRVSNAGAYRLYHKMGFNEIGVRKNYYPARKGREDALLLMREL